MFSRFFIGNDLIGEKNGKNGWILQIKQGNKIILLRYPEHDNNHFPG
jgi:hypothetical protein